MVIVWRFTGTRLLSETAEGRAQKLVAVQFFLLAPYVGGEAIHKLISGTARRRLATPSTGMTIRLEAATRLDRDSRLPRELARRRVLLIELMTC